MRQMAKRKCIIFAGTSEGRQLYEFCTKNRIVAIFCVATEYGKEILCKLNETKAYAQETKIHVGRMDETEMIDFFRKEKPELVVDATHPYAIEVTRNIRNAVQTYRQEQGIADKVYYRVLRNLTESAKIIKTEERTQPEERSDADKVSGAEQAPDAETQDTKISYHEDIRQAVAYLQSAKGNILATTGSKQAGELCKLKDFANRVYLRILPSEEMLHKCLKLGFLPDHVICMQGPFSKESNEQMLRKYEIKYLLTKQSGKAGGYPEKAEAARTCGTELVVLVPPQETEGVSVEKMCEMIGNPANLHI